MNDSYLCAESDFLTIEKFSGFLNYLKDNNYLSSSNINLSFSGGEPLLYPNLESLIDTAIDIVPNLYSIKTTTGLFYSDDMLNNLVEFMHNCSNKNVESINLSFSVDLDGSKNRYSNFFDLTNEINLIRTKRILPELLSISKTNYSYNTRLNNDSNLNKLINNIYSLFEIDSNIVVRISMVDGPTYYLDKDIKLFFDELVKNFNVSFTHKGSFTVEITSKESEYTFNNLMLMTLEDDIFALHPLDQRCWSWSRIIGISPKKYFNCYFGFYESDKIEDCIYIDENNPFYNVYNLLPDDCKICEYLAFCKLCPRQRRTYPCKDHPAMKEYMKQIFNVMISDPDKWCIE